MLDFVHDQMANGRQVRILNVVDDVTHECLATILVAAVLVAAGELNTLLEFGGRSSLIASNTWAQGTSRVISG